MKNGILQRAVVNSCYLKNGNAAVTMLAYNPGITSIKTIWFYQKSNLFGWVVRNYVEKT